MGSPCSWPRRARACPPHIPACFQVTKLVEDGLERPQHVIMNLPAIATEFLGSQLNSTVGDSLNSGDPESALAAMGSIHSIKGKVSTRRRTRRLLASSYDDDAQLISDTFDSVCAQRSRRQMIKAHLKVHFAYKSLSDRFDCNVASR